MPTTIGDPPEFLDINMYQLAWGLFLVPHDAGRPDRQPCSSINMSKQRHPISGEDALDCGARDTEVVADAVWSPLASKTETDDAMLATF